MKRILFTALLFASILTNAQNNQKLLGLIKGLPTIEYGTLPYWSGLIDKMSYFEHGFYTSDSLSVTDYNEMIKNSLLNDASSCYSINSKQKQIPCEQDKVFFIDRNGCSNKHYFLSKDNESFTDFFCPAVFPSAKSIVYGKYYLVYFWRAYFTESVLYYSLLFDFDGNLLSCQDLEYLNAGFPYFPFRSIDNKLRHASGNNTNTAFLPNNLLFVKYNYNLRGGGAYFINRLEEDGHYRTCKLWTEVGELDLDLTKKDKYQNYIRVDLDNNSKTPSLIIYSVQDADGYSNIREKDNANSKVLRTIKNKDVVFGTLTQTGWCKIEFTADEKGNIVEGGYIHLSRLKKLSDKYNEFVELPKREDWKKSIGLK